MTATDGPVVKSLITWPAKQGFHPPVCRSGGGRLTARPSGQRQAVHWHGATVWPSCTLARGHSVAGSFSAGHKVCSWLVASRPSNMIVQFRDRSAQTS